MDFSVLTPYGDLIVEGVKVTLLTSFGSLFLAVVFGFLLVLGRISSVPIIQAPFRIVINIIRGVPVLVQVYIFYFGLAQTNLLLPAWLCGVLALGLYGGGYMAEILRSGINSVSGGQIEASRSLGFTRRQTMRLIVWPQAIRISIPPAGGEFIRIMKATSLFAAIAVTELTYSGMIIRAETYASFEVYLPIAGIYLLITSVILTCFYFIEKSMVRKGWAVQ